jgi:hypothetical protein
MDTSIGKNLKTTGPTSAITAA